MAKKKIIDWKEERDKARLAKPSPFAVRAPIHISPKTEGQTRFWKTVEANVLTICNGPAGTGKTLIPLAIATKMLLANQIEKIVVSRPLVTCGNEQVGHLPGTLEEKVSPYIRHISEMFADLIPGNKISMMVDEGKIEFYPLAYLRGATLRNAFVLLDEAENATRIQLKMMMTRIGENCKMVLSGDLDQTDIPGYSGFAESMDRFDSLPLVSGARVVTLSDEDIVRSDIVRDIEKRWRNTKKEAKIQPPIEVVYPQEIKPAKKKRAKASSV